jgi:hypothetical protein
LRARLQLAATWACRLPGVDLHTQGLTSFSASKLALAFAMETRFISING